MSDKTGLVAGARLQQVATKEIVYQGCMVVQSDAVGLTFEVDRTVSEGGTIETVVSQIFVPWSQILHVIVTEQRT